MLMKDGVNDGGMGRSGPGMFGDGSGQRIYGDFDVGTGQSQGFSVKASNKKPKNVTNSEVKLSVAAKSRIVRSGSGSDPASRRKLY